MMLRVLFYLVFYSCIIMNRSSSTNYNQDRSSFSFLCAQCFSIKFILINEILKNRPSSIIFYYYWRMVIFYNTQSSSRKSIIIDNIFYIDLPSLSLFTTGERSFYEMRYIQIKSIILLLILIQMFLSSMESMIMVNMLSICFALLDYIMMRVFSSFSSSYQNQLSQPNKSFLMLI